MVLETFAVLIDNLCRNCVLLKDFNSEQCHNPSFLCTEKKNYRIRIQVHFRIKRGSVLMSGVSFFILIHL